YPTPSGPAADLFDVPLSAALTLSSIVPSSSLPLVPSSPSCPGSSCPSSNPKMSFINPATFSLSVSSSRPSLSFSLFILSLRRRGSLAHLTTSHGSFSPLSSQNRLQHFSFFSFTRYLIVAASPFHLFTLSITTSLDCALSPTPPLLSFLTFLNCSVSSSSHHLLLLLQCIAVLRWCFLNDTSFS